MANMEKVVNGIRKILNDNPFDERFNILNDALDLITEHAKNEDDAYRRGFSDGYDAAFEEELH